MCNPRVPRKSSRNPPFVRSSTAIVTPQSPPGHAIISSLSERRGKKAFHSLACGPREETREILLPVLSQNTFRAFENASLLQGHNTAHYAAAAVAVAVSPSTTTMTTKKTRRRSPSTLRHSGLLTQGLCYHNDGGRRRKNTRKCLGLIT